MRQGEEGEASSDARAHPQKQDSPTSSSPDTHTPTPGTDSPTLGSHTPTPGTSGVSQNCPSAEVLSPSPVPRKHRRAAIIGDPYNESCTLVRSKNAVVTPPTSHMSPLGSGDEYLHQMSLPVLRRQRCIAIDITRDTKQDGEGILAITPLDSSESSEPPLDLTALDSDDSEGDGKEHLFHSLPSSGLTPELSGRGLSGNEVSTPPGPSACSHRRMGSLPLHIQKTFGARPLTRAQSPLVLHELRSPPTATLRENRRCSAPVLTDCSSFFSDPSERTLSDTEVEKQTALCGSLSVSALISPVTSPKRTHKAASSRPSLLGDRTPPACPQLRWRKTAGHECSCSSESCDLQKKDKISMKQQVVFKKSLSLDDADTIDHARFIACLSATAMGDKKGPVKAQLEESVRNREELELEEQSGTVETSTSAAEGR